METATVQTMGTNKYGNIEKDELQTTLDNNTGDGVTEVIDNGDTVVVKFTESERYYEVDSNGNVIEYEIYEDTTPGELAIDDDGNYLIESIEDLVKFSQNVNSGNTYSGCTVKFARSLNFESIFSYCDYTTTDYDAYLGGEGATGLMEELINGMGFYPIGVSSSLSFQGTFDGCGDSLDNIYIDVSKRSLKYFGLFGYVSGASVENVEISGKICGESSQATLYCGGVAGITSSSASFMNCGSSVDIDVATSFASGYYGYFSVGGVIGIAYHGSIYGCYNIGNVSLSIGTGYPSVLTRFVGGVLGDGNSNEVLGCYNSGTIYGEDLSEDVYVGRCYWINGKL